jgi:hypothetical protein
LSISIYSQDRTGRNRTGRTGQAEENRLDGTGRTGQAGQNRQGGIAWTGYDDQKKDCQNRAARKGQQNVTGRTRLP